jgi:hypothetical protein
MHPEKTGDAIRDATNTERGADVTYSRYLANIADRLNRCGPVTDTRKSDQQAPTRVANEWFPGQFVVNHSVPRWLLRRQPCILRMNRGALVLCRISRGFMFAGPYARNRASTAELSCGQSK